MKSVIIYTDGACSGNPGPGGWGVYLRFGAHEKDYFGGEAHSTNQRMELRAAIEALQCLNQPCEVDLYTDSRYVIQGITAWIDGWKKRGWKNAAKKTVANQDLWQQLDEARQRHQVRWHWVKGHSGDAGNERADALARRGVPT